MRLPAGPERARLLCLYAQLEACREPRLPPRIGALHLAAALARFVDEWEPVVQMRISGAAAWRRDTLRALDLGCFEWEVEAIAFGNWHGSLRHLAPHLTTSGRQRLQQLVAAEGRAWHASRLIGRDCAQRIAAAGVALRGPLAMDALDATPTTAQSIRP
jgi:hypothetical protein